jgi:hypothetical protein
MSDQDEPKANERSDGNEGKRREPAHKAVASTGAPGSKMGMFVLLALLAGAAAGYFGHMLQVKAAAAKADSAAVGSDGKAGPCDAWEKKICSSTGEQSAACMQAKEATEILTSSACDAALAAVPATLTKVKAARASCDKLVSKLCADLPPGAQSCALVKEKTPSFPAQRCDEMLQHYDEVLGQLKQIEEQGGMGGPGRPRGGGPGGPGMSAPPGEPPH